MITAKACFAFLKSDRLLKRHEFKRVSREGTRFVGIYLCVDRAYYPDAGYPAKIGISASTRFGNAPERNRFKRQVREAFRQAKAKIPEGFCFNVTPRHLAKKAAFAEIQKDLYRFMFPSVPTSSSVQDHLLHNQC